MKKLLIVLMAFGSFSALAAEKSIEIQLTSQSGRYHKQRDDRALSKLQERITDKLVRDLSEELDLKCSLGDTKITKLEIMEVEDGYEFYEYGSFGKLSNRTLYRIRADVEATCVIKL